MCHRLTNTYLAKRRDADKLQVVCPTPSIERANPNLAEQLTDIRALTYYIASGEFAPTLDGIIDLKDEFLVRSGVQQHS